MINNRCPKLQTNPAISPGDAAGKMELAALGMSLLLSKVGHAGTRPLTGAFEGTCATTKAT